MSKDVQDLLSRYRSLKAERRVWESHWQDLAEVFLPRRADFTVSQVDGGKRTERIFDGTPMLARRGLAAAVDGLLKPKTSRWFRLRPQDRELEADDAVKRWVELAEERLWSALYDPGAKFVRARPRSTTTWSPSAPACSSSARRAGWTGCCSARCP